MNLTIDNTSCEEIIFTQGGVSHSLDKLYYGQHLVWEKQSGPANPYATQYFTVKSLANNNTIRFEIPIYDLHNYTGYTDLQSVSWSTDLTNWTTVTMPTSDEPPVIYVGTTVNYGEYVYFKGLGEGYTNTNEYTNSWFATVFNSTGQVKLSGNIMSLLYGDNFIGQKTLTHRGTFMAVFGSSNIVDIENLVLPATTLSKGCYKYMFGGSSITVAPELPAVTLAEYCYEGMFGNCASLTQIKCNATDITATQCVYEWVNNVAATGTFYKNSSMSSWATGIDGIPSGWTVVDW